MLGHKSCASEMTNIATTTQAPSSNARSPRACDLQALAQSRIPTEQVSRRSWWLRISVFCGESCYLSPSLPTVRSSRWVREAAQCAGKQLLPARSSSCLLALRSVHQHHHPFLAATSHPLLEQIYEAAHLVPLFCFLCTLLLFVLPCVPVSQAHITDCTPAVFATRRVASSAAVTSATTEL